jgi:hypothetical protein
METQGSIWASCLAADGDPGDYVGKLSGWPCRQPASRPRVASVAECANTCGCSIGGMSAAVACLGFANAQRALGLPWTHSPESGADCTEGHAVVHVLACSARRRRVKNSPRERKRVNLKADLKFGFGIFAAFRPDRWHNRHMLL